MSSDDIVAKQAAARPEGNADRAWVRSSFPEGDKPKNLTRGTLLGGKSSRARAVYVRELPEGGCLVINENGTHRVIPQFHPPEGDGWEALHDERHVSDSCLAQNRWSAKQNRKAAAMSKVSSEIDALEAPLPKGHPLEGWKAS